MIEGFMKHIIVFIILSVLLLPAQAQNTTYLSLQTESTVLQTGQSYEIRIQADSVVDLWLASVDITYDPSMIYVVGAKTGSPVQIGSLFTPSGSVIVLNQAKDQHVQYTASQLVPSEPLTGSGVIGTFKIYPLKAGNAVISFQQGELISVTFTGESDNRQMQTHKPPFSAVQLALTIMGGPVTPPVEASATLEPTATSSAPIFTQPAAQSTLENLSFLPTPQPTVPRPASTVSSNNDTGLIFLAGGLIVIAILGLGILMAFGRRGSVK
jgi:hypothetical protein